MTAKPNTGYLYQENEVDRTTKTRRQCCHFPPIPISRFPHVGEMADSGTTRIPTENVPNQKH